MLMSGTALCSFLLNVFRPPTTEKRPSLPDLGKKILGTFVGVIPVEFDCRFLGSWTGLRLEAQFCDGLCPPPSLQVFWSHGSIFLSPQSRPASVNLSELSYLALPLLPRPLLRRLILCSFLLSRTTSCYNGIITSFNSPSYSIFRRGTESIWLIAEFPHFSTGEEIELPDRKYGLHPPGLRVRPSFRPEFDCSYMGRHFDILPLVH